MVDPLPTETNAALPEVEAAIRGIYDGFSWVETPQGFDYWNEVVANLAGLVGKTPDDY